MLQRERDTETGFTVIKKYTPTSNSFPVATAAAVFVGSA